MTDSFWVLLLLCAPVIGQASIKSLVLSQFLPYLLFLALSSPLCIWTSPFEYPKSIWNSTFAILNSTILFLKLDHCPLCPISGSLIHNLWVILDVSLPITPISNHPDLPILPPKYFSNHSYSYSFIISHVSLVTTTPLFGFSCHYYYWSSRSLAWHSTCKKDNPHVFIKGGESETSTHPCLKPLSFTILLACSFYKGLMYIFP